MNALDTLFFKDAKPFSMGEETWAESLFPPPPSVFYGTIRTLYFIQNPQQLPLLNTADDPTRDLEIQAIYFNINDSPHFIAPRDIVKVKSGHEEYIMLEPAKNNGVNSYDLPYRLIPPISEAVEDASGWVTNLSLRSYIGSDEWPNEGKVYPYTEFALTEAKIGIGRNRQYNAASEGMLYRVGMKRMAFPAEAAYDEDQPNNETLIEIDFEGLPSGSLDKEGFSKIGGEGKAVHYILSEEDGILPEWTPESVFFKIYLLTPAIFKTGWLPSWLQWSDKDNTYKGTWNGLPLKLQAAAIGKPVPIGGFDVYHKQPKPMYKAVPAGSVYYFELEDVSKIPLLASLHLASVSEAREAWKNVVYDSRKEGFGRILIGKSSIAD